MAKSTLSKRPRWSKSLRSYAKSYSDRVKENIEEIAESLASHESLAQVDEKDIDAAFNMLSHAGLRVRRWIDRPESEAALGSLFVIRKSFL